MAANDTPSDASTDLNDSDLFDALTDEQVRRLFESPPTATVHAYVDVTEVWELARERAELFGDSERAEEYLFDYVDMRFSFLADGEEVHATGGFDPEQVVTPDSEADRPTLTDSEDTATATIEVDVSPEAWTAAVEWAESVREHGYGESIDLDGSNAAPEQYLVDQVELGFKWTVDGEDVSAVARGEE